MKRRTRFSLKLAVACLLMMVLVAACGNPTGQALNGSNSAPAVVQPGAGSQVDPQGDQIDQGLQNLQNDLNSVDTLNDFK